MEIFMVGVGGFLGSCSRFVLTKWTNQAAIPLPLGTLLSNVIAGLLIGLVIGLEAAAVSLSPKAKLFLTTGLCGGLSTFSTFSLETVLLFQGEKYGLAAWNVLLNLSCSILAVLLGLMVAKAFLQKI